MTTRAARQIREAILIAQQVMRSERLGPRKFKSALAVDAYMAYRKSHRWDSRLGAITRIWP